MHVSQNIQMKLKKVNYVAMTLCFRYILQMLVSRIRLKKKKAFKYFVPNSWNNPGIQKDLKLSEGEIKVNFKRT